MTAKQQKPSKQYLFGLGLLVFFWPGKSQSRNGTRTDLLNANKLHWTSERKKKQQKKIPAAAPLIMIYI